MMKAQRCEQYNIKFNTDFYKFIDDYCVKSKNLYNYANYIIRQEFINNNRWIRYNELFHLVKDSEPYQEIGSIKVEIFHHKIRLLLPDKTIWLYTGFEWQQCIEDLKRRAIISKCDILVDGKYIDTLKDITLKWRGSSNQRVIDIQRSLKEGRVILYEI